MQTLMQQFAMVSETLISNKLLNKMLVVFGSPCEKPSFPLQNAIRPRRPNTIEPWGLGLFA